MAGCKRAEFVSREEIRFTDDVFHLAHSMKPEDKGGDVLILFEEPLVNIQGLYMESDQGPELPFEQVYFLDADLETFYRRAVVRHDIRTEW